MASHIKINNDPKYKIVKNIQQQLEEKFYPQLLSLTSAGEKWLKTIEEMNTATKGYLSTLNEFSKTSPDNCDDAKISSNQTKEIARNFDLVLKEYTESIECIKKFVSKLQAQSKREKGHIATMKETFDQQVKKKNALLKKKKITNDDVQEFLDASLEDHRNIARIRYEFVKRFNKEITVKQCEFYKNAIQLIDPSCTNTRHNTLSKEDKVAIKNESNKEDENLDKQLMDAAEEIKNIVQEEHNNNVINIQEINTTDTESIPSHVNSTLCQLYHEELPEMPFTKDSTSLKSHSTVIEDFKSTPIVNEKKEIKITHDYENNISKQKDVVEEFERKIKESKQTNSSPINPKITTKSKKDIEKETTEHHHSHHHISSYLPIHKETHVKHHSTSYAERDMYQDRIPIPAPDYDNQPIPIFKYNTWEYGNLVVAKIYYSPRSRAELGLEAGKKYFFMKGGNRGWIFCRDLDTSRSGWCPSDFVDLFQR
ncbi:SH3 domain-containing protein [Strongyloides ratti]|uniref:SH3 domain-containing protein n=1 Tax=Strongyloides ratti TaxID=34506 RepID=A0A090KSM2_STRRB|nr:SH3 domain-containing protein [Strongyloides ratti]CEF60406.1 SH3 domain-containing protein [Strongyloides ratti]